MVDLMNSKLSFILGMACMAVMCLAVVASTTQVYRGQVTVATDRIFYIFETSSGKATIEAEAHNVITDIGENRTRCLISRNTTAENGVLWISIGNATAATGLTQLTTEYARAEGTVTEWTNGGDSAYNLTYKFTFAETVNINCAGSHWSNTGDGNLYAVANFGGGAQTFNSNDNATIVWVKTYNCND